MEGTLEDLRVMRQADQDRDDGFAIVDDNVDFGPTITSEIQKYAHLPSAVQSELYADLIYQLGFGDDLLE